MALVSAGLVLVEPAILEAPFENSYTLWFTFGSVALGCLAFAVMLRHRLRPGLRVAVLIVPLVAGSFWLLSPFFIDDTVSDEFVTSIAAAETEAANRSSTSSPGSPATSTTTPEETQDSVPAAPRTVEAPQTDALPPTPSAGGGPAPYRPPSPPTNLPPVPEEPSGPRLLGAGDLVGLAGHRGTGRAGFFEKPDGSLVLRLEEFDISNGPDLRLYVIPGAGQTSPTPASLYLGTLRGNVGDQTYELPDGSITTGDWTVLVWCEAFSVEFVGGTVAVIN